MRRRLLLLAAVLTPVVAAGCFRAPNPPAASGQPRAHQHHPPHGGTPVVLGNEDYHLELVLDPAAGTLQAFVLDDEMEDFVRSPAPSLVIAATDGAGRHRLVLAAVANPETGESVGDTALFEGQADWLKTSAVNFDGVIESVTIRGRTFTGVTFNFPKGNDSGD